MTLLSPPSEATAVAGVDVPASFWNAQVRDAVTFLANPPLCIAYASTVQSIPNATWTSILFGANRIDSYSGHSTVTNTSRYVAQVAGWYDVRGVIVAGTATVNNLAVRLAVNGTAVLGSANNGPANTPAGNAAAETNLDVFLNAGDYVEVQMFQSSGSAMNTAATATDFTSCMRVRWAHV